MPTLLYVLLPGHDESTMIWPSQQPPTIRAQADRHADGCDRCIMEWGRIWDTTVPKATFSPRCDVGIGLARSLVTAR